MFVNNIAMDRKVSKGQLLIRDWKIAPVLVLSNSVPSK